MTAMPSSSLAPRTSNLFLGIDIGTSGIRAIAIDANNHVCAEVRVALAEPVHNGNAIEQDPELWWSGLCHVLNELSNKIDATQVKTLCLDGTSGTVLLCDKNGEPVSPGLMYNDARAVDFLKAIAQHAPVDSAVHSATSGLAKLLWLKERPYAEQAQYCCHQADWLNGKLCGLYRISDSNNSLKTGYDPLKQCWPTWLDDLKINRDWLPRVTTPGTFIGNIDPEIARQLGLSVQTQILSGSTDSTAAIMATGAHQPGEAVTSLGSTLVVKVITEQPIFDKNHGVYSQPFGDHWLVGGGSNSGGAVLRHYFSSSQMRSMESQLDIATPTGLNYYPLLGAGERFPHNDPDWPARLTPRPERDSVFFQGLLEGLTQIEYDGYRLLAELGAPYPEKIYTVGGGSMNAAWVQMRQQRLGVSMLIPDHTEAAYGMAQLAKQGFEAQA